MLKEKIAKAVSLTPSGDNCQPFALEWIGDIARISYESELAKHKLNMNEYSSILSLGCLLENVRIASLSEGLEPIYELSETHPLKPFVINFRPIDRKEDRLLSAMAERCTDRRKFNKGSVDEIQKILNDIQKDYKAQAKILQKLPDRVYDFMKKSDLILWKDLDVFLNTVKWIRFTKGEALRTMDGMPFANLGLNFITKTVLWIMSRRRSSLNIFRMVAGEKEGEKMIVKQLTSAGGFFFLTIKEKTPHEMVEVGKLAQRLWIELTNLGYGVQPLTLPTLLTYTYDLEGLPGFKPEVLEIIKDGSIIMKEELGLPVWGFRFGKIDRLPDTARTYRRN
jgi:hypothetical protein